MPVAAAGHADVVAAHLNPLEVGRRGDHLAQQLAIAGLEAILLAQRPLCRGDPVRQLVAQPLQLPQVEDPRLRGHRADAVVELDPAEGLGQEAGELALEMADLTPQLDPGEALVDLDAEPHRAVSFEQIRHRLHRV